MATPATLRFRARAEASAPNHDLEEAGIRASVGRRALREGGVIKGFTHLDEKGQPIVTEVRYRSEYVKYCADGDLWPADEATAQACGVKFDPSFGSAKAPEPDASAAQAASTDKADKAGKRS